VIGQRFADQADRARVEFFQGAAIRSADAVASDARLTQRSDELASLRIHFFTRLAMRMP
jgi:hypothetical protein